MEKFKKKYRYIIEIDLKELINQYSKWLPRALTVHILEKCTLYITKEPYKREKKDNNRYIKQIIDKEVKNDIKMYESIRRNSIYKFASWEMILRYIFIVSRGSIIHATNSVCNDADCVQILSSSSNNGGM